MLPDDLDARLRREARRRGVSIAEVAREALEQHLPAEGSRPLSFIGMFEGESSDASERVDEIVSRAIIARHSGDEC